MTEQHWIYTGSVTRSTRYTHGTSRGPKGDIHLWRVPWCG